MAHMINNWLHVPGAVLLRDPLIRSAIHLKLVSGAVHGHLVPAMTQDPSGRGAVGT